MAGNVMVPETLPDNADNNNGNGNGNNNENVSDDGNNNNNNWQNDFDMSDQESDAASLTFKDNPQLSSVLKAMDNRQLALERGLERLLDNSSRVEGLLNARKGRDDNGDVSDGSDDLGESMTRRFAWLEEKTRISAVSGLLPPADLGLMIDPTSALHHKFNDPAVLSMVDDGDSGFKAIRTKKTEADLVSRFQATIPSLPVFQLAWTNLMVLMCAGLAPDHHRASRLQANMSAYMEWISDQASQNTWLSICRYHVRFTTKIFKGGASSPSKWVHYADPRIMGLLEPIAWSAATTTPSSSKASNKRRATNPASSNASRSGELCGAWNFSRCADPCRRGRRHACFSCSGPHRISKCPSAKKDK